MGDYPAGVHPRRIPRDGCRSHRGLAQVRRGRFFRDNNRLYVLKCTFEVLWGAVGAVMRGHSGVLLRLERRVQALLHEECIGIVEKILEGSADTGPRSHRAIKNVLQAIRE